MKALRLVTARGAAAHSRAGTRERRFADRADARRRERFEEDERPVAHGIDRGSTGIRGVQRARAARPRPSTRPGTARGERRASTARGAGTTPRLPVKASARQRDLSPQKASARRRVPAVGAGTSRLRRSYRRSPWLEARGPTRGGRHPRDRLLHLAARDSPNGR